MNGGGGYEDVRGQVATFLLNQDNTNTQQMIGQLQPASGLQQLIEVSHFLHKQTIHPQHIHFIAVAAIILIVSLPARDNQSVQSGDIYMSGYQVKAGHHRRYERDMLRDTA